MPGGIEVLQLLLDDGWLREDQINDRCAVGAAIAGLLRDAAADR